ncbi:MAG: LON peptidase substrate-binding domain-containing protein, partial [Solirubrobacterales bacterium]
MTEQGTTDRRLSYDPNNLDADRGSAVSDADIRIETSPTGPGPANAARPDSGTPDELAILPLRESVLFPQAVIPLAVARPASVRAVDEAVLGHRLIG